MKTHRSYSLLVALAMLFAFAIPSVSLAKDLERTRVSLQNSGEEPAASGYAEFRLKKRNRMRFKVEVEDLTPANYDLMVGGVVRGTLDVRALASGKVEGELEFDTKREPGKLPLDFDPRGELIEVVRSGIVYLSVTFPDGGSGGGSCN